jgi:hypothetical protein
VVTTALVSSGHSSSARCSKKTQDKGVALTKAPSLLSLHAARGSQRTASPKLGADEDEQGRAGEEERRGKETKTV